MGLTYVRATAEEVVGELEVSARHRKADGTLDEGIYCGLVGAAASVGAALYASQWKALQWKRPVVGVENLTSFLATARSGRILVTATPVFRDLETQIWEGNVTDKSGRLLAYGRLRFICPEEDSTLTCPVLDSLGP